MSALHKFLAGWSFRTTTPSLEPGETVSVFVAEYEPETGEGIVFVGDTRLAVANFDPDALGDRVAVRITDFDPDESVGRGEFEGVVEESSYDV